VQATSRTDGGRPGPSGPYSSPVRCPPRAHRWCYPRPRPTPTALWWSGTRSRRRAPRSPSSPRRSWWPPRPRTHRRRDPRQAHRRQRARRPALPKRAAPRRPIRWPAGSAGWASPPVPLASCSTSSPPPRAAPAMRSTAAPVGAVLAPLVATLTVVGLAAPAAAHNTLVSVTPPTGRPSMSRHRVSSCASITRRSR